MPAYLPPVGFHLGLFTDSELIEWCENAIENFEFEPTTVNVTLLNEIVIRATISDKGSGDRKKPTADKAEKEAIITECVEQVLDILEDKTQR